MLGRAIPQPRGAGAPKAPHQFPLIVYSPSTHYGWPCTAVDRRWKKGLQVPLSATFPDVSPIYQVPELGKASLNSFVQCVLCPVSPKPRSVTPFDSGRNVTSSQFDSFGVEPVGYGRPTDSSLLPRVPLHGVVNPAGGVAPRRGRVARRKGEHSRQCA